MRRIRFALMGLLLVVALAGLGVAYALWSETLTINGTVRTGEVEARWWFASCNEFYPWPPGPPDYPGEFGGKDVGSVNINIDPNDPHLIHFTINNGYPSYAVDCGVKYTNTGTIPWVVEAIGFTPGQNLTNCTVTRNPVTGSFTATCDQLTVIFVDGLCTQIDPGDQFGIASDMFAHVEQGAAESTTYRFDVTIQVNQWNESQCRH